jgi:tRNA(Ser,Leu) C12 N-acetylase TAN1
VQDWNVIVTVFQDGYRRALRALRDLGSADRSPYHNVLIMKVDDPLTLLAAVEARTEESPALYDAVSRVAPAQRSFDFHSAEDFMDNVRSILREWSPILAGRAFHVRLNRRGTRHDLRTQETERLLNDAALDAAGGMAVSGKIAFTDADAVIAIDAIDNRAGVGLWTREDLARHRLLRPD